MILIGLSIKHNTPHVRSEGMEIEIRPLIKTDIPNVIELTKGVWGGHDHLPKIVNGWLSSPNCHPMVLDYDGELAAVANLKAIDAGYTGWMEGMRVHSTFREKGLAKHMTNRLVEMASEIGFKRIRLVTSGENEAPQKLARSVGMEVIDRFSVFWKRYGRGTKWVEYNDSIVKASVTQVLNFTQSHPELFPSHSIVFHWDVFDLTLQNIKSIKSKADFYVIKNELGVGFSLGFQNDIPPEPEWCFTVHASSFPIFESLLNFHLKKARDQGLRDFLCIHQPEFKSQYNKVRWLKRRAHELDLLLFERIF